MNLLNRTLTWVDHSLKHINSDRDILHEVFSSVRWPSSPSFDAEACSTSEEVDAERDDRTGTSPKPSKHRRPGSSFDIIDEPILNSETRLKRLLMRAVCCCLGLDTFPSKECVDLLLLYTVSASSMLLLNKHVSISGLSGRPSAEHPAAKTFLSISTFS